MIKVSPDFRREHMRNKSVFFFSVTSHVLVQHANDPLMRLSDSDRLRLPVRLIVQGAEEQEGRRKGSEAQRQEQGMNEK